MALPNFWDARFRVPLIMAGELELPRRSTILFEGGLTAEDDPTHEVTRVSCSADVGAVRTHLIELTLGQLQELGEDETVATINAAALPAGAFVVGADVEVLDALTATGLSASTLSLSTTDDDSNYTALMGAVSLATLTGDGLARRTTAGSNEWRLRGGQVPRLRFTLTGAFFADLTQGAVNVRIYYLLAAAEVP